MLSHRAADSPPGLLLVFPNEPTTIHLRSTSLRPPPMFPAPPKNPQQTAAVPPAPLFDPAAVQAFPFPESLPPPCSVQRRRAPPCPTSRRPTKQQQQAGAPPSTDAPAGARYSLGSRPQPRCTRASSTLPVRVVATRPLLPCLASLRRRRPPLRAEPPDQQVPVSRPFLPSCSVCLSLPYFLSSLSLCSPAGPAAPRGRAAPPH